MRAAAAADAGKIMVVGDSISQGSSGDWTWRYRLAKHLAAGAVTADFVGPRNDLYNVMTTADGDWDRTYADPAFDQDHNAVWGRPLAYELHDIGGKVSQHQPDYLLVLLGINDIGFFARTPAQVEADLRGFIANARAAKPDVRFVLGKLLPTTRAADDPAFAATVADYNARLVAAAGVLTTTQSSIVVADTAAGFVAADHTWDGTHPNARGELRIAAAFADALSAGFGVGTPYPRPLPVVPIGPQQPPVATVAATGEGTADLAWTPSLGATQYWIWVKDTTVNTEWTRLPIPLTQDHNPWHMSQLQAGMTYQYKVQAAKGDDAGAFSDVVTLQMTGTTPSAPSGLTATAGNGQAVLAWNAAAHATGYKVLVRNVTAGEADFTELPYPVPGPRWTAELLQNGATYEFKLRSVNGALTGGTSAAVTVTPTGPTPAGPTGLSVANGNGEATLSWTSDPDATGHEVFVRNVTAGENDFTKLPYPVPGNSWVAGALVNGAGYEFKLRAVNGAIPGGFSAVVTARPTVAPPAAPAGLTATAGNGQAVLRWTEAPDATGYYVHIRNVTAGETGFTKLPYPVPGSEWTAAQLQNGATYQFKLQSVSGLIEGAQSAAVTVTPTVPPPAGPTGFTATAGSHEALLRWTEAPDATGYYVHARNVTAGETGFTKLPYPVPGSQWTAAQLQNGVTYQFKLQSVSGLIEGGFSSTVTVSPTGPAPGAPANMAAQAGNRKAILTWTMPDHGTSVYVFVRNVSAGESGFTRLPYPIAGDSWTATQLANGATYQFKVQAYNDLIAGGTSATVTVVPSGPPAPGAENLTAVPGDRKATLRWTAASQATAYYIWVRNVTAGEANFTRLQYPIADDTWVSTLMENGARYEFRVQSVDGLVPGGFSNTVSVVPWGPTPQVGNLRVTPRLGEAALAWSGSGTATGYYIQLRNASRGEGFTELPYPVAGNSFTASLLTPGQVYEFRVQAVSGRQRGVTSNTVAITVPLPPPVTGLSVRPVLHGLALSWNAVPGADAYMIYYSDPQLCGGIDSFPPGSRALMHRMPYPVSGTSFTIDYLFKPDCYWVDVVPVKYGVESAYDYRNLGRNYTLKSNDDSHLYEAVVTYIHRQMYDNVRSEAAQRIKRYLNDTNPGVVALGYYEWYNQVKPGGPWDHKPLISRGLGPGLETGNAYSYRYRVTGGAYEVYYDIWSNMHYGYVGLYCGFTQTVLQEAAGRVGIDDPGDRRSIRLGFDLWNANGSGLSRGRVDSIVRANLAAYAGESKANPFTLRYIPNVR
ncbi:fibronectin type III domain-containing protein [Actinoplanes italicus]|uniref:fibronectin type III domain-containing protein n=1 Tax=Actinoplanes italicus TaxID=113567 RepID=UPI000D06296D|nr:fibronectin type III domain-containing protein [Actinoplanes italicus]